MENCYTPHPLDLEVLETTFCRNLTSFLGLDVVGLTTVGQCLVKLRVLWRLVYLVPVVAGWGWLMVCRPTLSVSGTQAASCSAGVRMPMAQWGRMVPVPVDPLGGGDHGRRRYPARGPGQRMSSALYSELSASARAKPKGGYPWSPQRRPPRTRPGQPRSGWTCTARRGRSGAPGPSGRRPRAGAAR